jgi:hypothetical protein
MSNIPEWVHRADFIDALKPLCALLDIDPMKVDAHIVIGPERVDFAEVATEARGGLDTTYYRRTVRIEG